MQKQPDPGFLTTYKKFVIFILPVVFILLVSEVSNASNKDSKNETEPVDCLEYGLCLNEIVAEREKVTMLPQDKFYEYVCPLYNKNVTNKTQLLDLETFHKTQLIRMYNEKITSKDHGLLHIAKKLFRTCIEDENKTNSLGIIKNITEEIGGWPAILKDGRWNYEKFEWKRSIVKLRDIGVPPSILKLSVVPTSNNTKQFSKVGSRFHVSIVPNNFLEHKGRMIQLAYLFGPSSAAVVRSDYDKVLDLWNKLRKLEKSPVVEYSIRNYINATLPFNWIPLLNGLMGTPGYFIDKFVLLFPPTNTTIQFLKIMNETSPRTLANYIIWSMVYQLSPLLDEKVRKLAAVKYKSREEFCLAETEKRFELNPVQFEADKRYLPKKNRQAVYDVVFNLKTEILEMMKDKNRFRLFGFPTSEALIETIDWITVVVARPKDYETDADVYHAQSVGMSTMPYQAIRTFLTWALLATKNHDTYVLRQGINPSMHFNLQYFNNYDITYYKDINTLFIPRVVVLRCNYTKPQSPFDDIFTKAILGVKVLTKLFISLEKPNSEYYRHATECTWRRIVDYTHAIDRDWVENHSQLYPTAPNETTRFVLAVRLARDMFMKELQPLFKSTVERHNETMFLGSSYFKPTELFWISVAASMCAPKDTELGLINKMKLYIAFGDHFNFIREENFKGSYIKNENITLLLNRCRLLKEMDLYCKPHCDP